MNQLVPLSSPALLALVAAAGERASTRFLEFFGAYIRNPHTRRAYYRAAEEFVAWRASIGVPSIAAVQPVRVATWIEASTRELAAPSVKQRLVRCATCSIGWSTARSCRSTRRTRFAGRVMS
jgi:integrase/recombinase XerC